MSLEDYQSHIVCLLELVHLMLFVVHGNDVPDKTGMSDVRPVGVNSVHVVPSDAEAFGHNSRHDGIVNSYGPERKLHRRIMQVPQNARA